MGDGGFLIADDEFPDGIRCAGCDIELFPGERYYESLTAGFVGETSLVLLVCARCRGQTISVVLPSPMRQAMEGAEILAKLEGGAG